MTEIRCGSCGGTLLHEAGSRPREAPPSCPRCGSSVQVIAEEARVAAGSQPLSPYRTGTILLEAEPAHGPSRPAAPAEVEVKVRGFLTVEGALPGRSDFRLRGAATVIGREQGEIVIPDPALSGRHFQVEERDSEFFVRDLESSNGTYVNGNRVECARLRSGDRIHAGSTLFLFSVRHAIPM